MRWWSERGWLEREGEMKKKKPWPVLLVLCNVRVS